MYRRFITCISIDLQDLDYKGELEHREDFIEKDLFKFRTFVKKFVEKILSLKIRQKPIILQHTYSYTRTLVHTTATIYGNITV
jgi:hypothetical protein